jgi:glutamyl-tRNA reductase
MLTDMGILLLGVNHRTAPVHVREQLAFGDTELRTALADLVDRETIDEALIVSTCNRVEVIAAGSADDACLDRMMDVLGWSGGLSGVDLEEHIYVHRDLAAIRHLFRVASSLDSMIVGEPQILGQVREAYRVGLDAGTVGRNLTTLMQSAFATAKRVRTETAIGFNAVSVSFVAVELGRKIFGALKDRVVLLIGAGEMAELAVQHLVDSGVSGVLVANRTHERAETLAGLHGATAVEFEDLGTHLVEPDIVICSTAAPDYVLRAADVRVAQDRRRNRPLCIIDISVPRQVDPAAAELDNVFLFDMDDLQRVVGSNLKEREREASLAEVIVDDEVSKYVGRVRTADIGPTVTELKERLNDVAIGEYRRLRRRLGDLTPEQEEAILSVLLPSIVNKISHPMIAHMRDSARRDGHADGGVSIWRRIFGLGGGEQ